jgi:uncharacterized protein YceK
MISRAMNTLHFVRFAIGMAAIVLSGCASIVSGRTATVKIDSRPSDAEVVIRDKHGNEVLTTHTPATVELRRKDRFIWPAKYTATIEKPGYQPQTVPINSTLNPWVLGNVVIGGPIGLVVDSATGAGWRPKVASIQQDLEPIYTAQQPGAPYSAAQEQQNVQPATAIY